MAAGAAHELSTPLGTVALAAKELERALDASRRPRRPRGRCAADPRAGRPLPRDPRADGAGRRHRRRERRRRATVGELVDETLVGIREAPRVLREIPDDGRAVALRLPPRAVSQALRSLVTNAQDASPRDVGGRGHARALERRRARGDDPRSRRAASRARCMARIGEPFFTTKAPGRGMGLGLFLARAVIEGVGGSLQIDSAPGGGTAVACAAHDVGARSSVAAAPACEPPNRLPPRWYPSQHERRGVRSRQS